MERFIEPSPDRLSE